jgi:hypothetical protein
MILDRRAVSVTAELLRAVAIMRVLIGLMSLVAAVPYSAAEPGKRFVSTPEASWDDMLPYVRSHVVPWLTNDEFHVYVCTEQVLREVVQFYDDVLGDFAKVLLFQGLKTDSNVELFQGLKTDSNVEEAISRATDRFRAGLDNLDEDDRTRYRELFWRQLVQSDGFVSGLQELYEKARNKGKLRCSLCEKDPTFDPAGLQ